LKIVDTEETFLKELDEFSPDIILSDYELPAFDGLAALRIAQEKCPDVPFIIVSGKLGEEFAIEKLREGATDYVLKSNLKRLVPVVKRAIEEAKMIAERKQAIEALRESEETARMLLNIPVAAAFLIDRHGICLGVNETLATRLGRKVSDFIGKPIWDFFPSDVSARRKAHFETVLLDKRQVRYEDEREGMWNDSIISPILDDRGEVAKVAVLGFDITERKKAEEALRESEERYSIMANSSPNVVLIHKNGIIHYVNDFGLRITGYHRDEVMGKSMLEFLSDDSKEVALMNIQRRLAGEHVENYELKVITKSKDIKYFLVSSTVIPYEKETAFLVVLSDINERKKMEKELLYSHSLLTAALDSTADGILIVDRYSKVTGFNRKFLELWRIPTSLAETHDDNLLLNFVFDQLEDPEAFLKKVEELYEKPEASSFDEIRFRDRRIFERYSQPQRIGDNLVGRVWSFRDITERKQADDEINMLSSVVKQSTEGMAIADLDGKLTFVNDAWCKMHGYTTPGELLGKSLTISHNKAQIENEVEPFNKRVIELGTYRGEVGHITRDGKPFPTLMVTTLLKDKQGKPYALAAIARDITELKRAEKEILKRVKELEDFYDIAIDRELRMMKLKKQMEDMKIKLDKYENQKKNIPQD